MNKTYADCIHCYACSTNGGLFNKKDKSLEQALKGGAEC